MRTIYLFMSRLPTVKTTSWWCWPWSWNADLDLEMLQALPDDEFCSREHSLHSSSNPTLFTSVAVWSSPISFFIPPISMTSCFILDIIFSTESATKFSSLPNRCSMSWTVSVLFPSAWTHTWGGVYNYLPLSHILCLL